MSIIKLTEKDLSNIIKQVINNSNAKKFILKEDCVKSMALIDPNTGKPAYIDSKTGKYCDPNKPTPRGVNPTFNTHKSLTDLIVTNSNNKNTDIKNIWVYNDDFDNFKKSCYLENIYSWYEKNIKFDDIVISLNPETLNNIETIASTLRNNHLGTEVVVKYDEHYKLNWEEVADKLVGAFGGYVWCKGGFETYLLPTEFHTEKLYEFNR